MTAEERSILQSIWDNRFVKFTIPYAIGAWGIIQVAAFLESRYSWANGFPDFLLVLALVMLPSVLLFSYYRGKYSKNLQAIEKIFIPVNLLLAFALAFFGVGKSDLKAAPAKISVVNEEGETVERTVPNLSSIRRVVLLSWDNKLEDPEDQWMSYTLPEILGSDLEQDHRLVSISPKAIASDYAEYSASPITNTPFSIQRKIASDKYCDYFLNGKIEKEGDNYQITASLFNTKSGKEFYGKKYEGQNPLDIVDEISEDFRKEVYVENELDENFVDLPVSDLYSSSLEALKYFGQSFFKADYENNINAAIANTRQAIKIDPKFALAHFSLCDYLFRTNQIGESKQSIEKAMELKSGLPERMQLGIKSTYMSFDSSAGGSKAISLLEMWSQLYPKEIEPYELLLMFYKMLNETEKAKETALRALENGHRGSMLLTLANMENAQGNSDKAIEYYDQFEKEFPDALALIPNIKEEFANNPTGPLVKVANIVNKVATPIAIKLSF